MLRGTIVVSPFTVRGVTKTGPRYRHSKNNCNWVELLCNRDSEGKNLRTLTPWGAVKKQPLPFSQQQRV